MSGVPEKSCPNFLPGRGAGSPSEGAQDVWQAGVHWPWRACVFPPFAVPRVLSPGFCATWILLDWACAQRDTRNIEGRGGGDPEV